MAHAKPTLYYNWASEHAALPLVLLIESGHEHDVELKRVDMMKGEHKTPDFLAINPNGQVPAMVDGDLRLYESGALCRYLAIKYKSKLWPVDDLHHLGPIDVAYEHIRTGAWRTHADLLWLGTWAPMITKQPKDEVALKAKVEGMDKQLAHIDANFFKESDHHMVGKSQSLADVALVVMLYYTLRSSAVDISGHKKLSAWWHHQKGHHGYKQLDENVNQFAAHFGWKPIA